MLERLKPDGRLIATDLDPANIRLAKGRLEKVKGKSAVRFDLFISPPVESMLQPRREGSATE